MAIPKKIHYVWVGGKEKPTDIKMCIKTWKKLDGYEIIEWNESNFDINSHPFVKEAYKNKKWAFVSDYIRAYVIYNYGGIYLDTDVLVLDNFDDLLKNRAFVGYENSSHPFTAVFGAEEKHPLIKKMLDYYDNLKIDFNFTDNNTISVSNILVNEYKCKLGNKEQLLKDGIKVLKEDVLCNPSKNSKTIHVFTGTWLDDNTSDLKKKIIKFLKLRATTKKRAQLYRKYIMKNKEI